MARRECRYYQIERLTVEGRDLGDDALRDARVFEVPWCSHPKHSPLDRPTAMSLRTRALQCGGLYAHCPLSPGQFADAASRG